MTSPGRRPLPVALESIPAPEWAAAVVSRHSCRTFTGRPIPADLLSRLERFAVGLPGQETARLVVLSEVPEKLFTGFLAGYGRVIGAPSALVMIGNEGDESVQESVGFLGQAGILKATSLGLDTCWIAGYLDHELAQTIVDLRPGERVFAVTPLGYCRSGPRTAERLMQRVVGARKRRSLEEIAPGFDESRWPGWAAQGVRLVRLAPSAHNRQPWTVTLLAEPDPLVRPPDVLGAIISEAHRGPGGGVSRRLDCGIAMLHFEVGARLVGQSGYWQVGEPPEVARYMLSSTG